MNILHIVLIYLLFFFQAEITFNPEICRDFNSENTVNMLSILLGDGNESIQFEGGYQSLTIDDVTQLSYPEHEAECSLLAEKQYYYNSELNIEVSYFKASDRYFLVTYFKDMGPLGDGLTFESGKSAAIMVLDENLEVVHAIFL